MIMDGNRRWARENGLSAVMLGHKSGVESVKVAIKFCIKKGIKYLSLFTFSIENFRRDKTEQSYIFDLLVDVIKNDLLDLIKNGIRIRFIGDRKFFPEKVRSVISEVEEKTKHLTNLNLNMLFCYGARQEIVNAAKKVAKKVSDGILSVDEIDESEFRNNLWTDDIPDADLVVRTGKVSRLSNFLLFQSAYSELMFLDCYWPEINEDRLRYCFDDFHGVQRNFGK